MLQGVCGDGRTGRGTGLGSGRKGRIPLLALPTLAVNVVNRYQILGQVPKPFNSVLASQPKVNDPLDICGPEPQPIRVSSNYRNYPKSMTKLHPVNLFCVEPHMTDKIDPVKLAMQFFPWMALHPSRPI